MNSYYFIINHKEHVCVTAESESLAIEAHRRFSINKRYIKVSTEEAGSKSKLIESIVQRKTENKSF